MNSNTIARFIRGHKALATFKLKRKLMTGIGMLAILTATALPAVDAFAGVNITFDPAEGVVPADKSIQVKLSVKDDAMSAGHGDTDLKVYYTLDGSRASALATPYSGNAIEVRPPKGFHTVTVNAVAIGEDGEAAMASATYTFYTPGDDVDPTVAHMSLPEAVYENDIPDDTPDRYHRVYSPSELRDGDRVIFVAAKGEGASRTYITMGRFYDELIRGLVVQPEADGGIPAELPARANAFTLHALPGDGHWALEFASDGKYLGISDRIMVKYDDAVTPNTDFEITPSPDGNCYLTWSRTPIQAMIDIDEPANNYWKYRNDDGNEGDRLFDLNPMVYRLGTPPAPRVNVPACLSDELYVTLDSNLAYGNRRPTATRLQYDGEGTYKALIADVQGQLIIRDGKATLDGSYYGADTGEDSSTEYASPLALMRAPSISSPVSISSDSEISLIHKPSVIVPLTTDGDTPLKVLSATFSFSHIPGDTAPGTLAAQELVVTSVGTIKAETDPAENASPAYYDLMGRRLGGEPTAPGIYLRRTPDQTVKFSVR